MKVGLTLNFSNMLMKDLLKKKDELLQSVESKDADIEILREQVAYLMG